MLIELHYEKTSNSEPLTVTVNVEEIDSEHMTFQVAFSRQLSYSDDMWNICKEIVDRSRKELNQDNIPATKCEMIITDTVTRLVAIFDRETGNIEIVELTAV